MRLMSYDMLTVVDGVFGHEFSKRSWYRSGGVANVYNDKFINLVTIESF